jgi:hypothetical protein
MQVTHFVLFNYLCDWFKILVPVIKVNHKYDAVNQKTKILNCY